MEEDAELEEGEAKEPLDPDTDFSYLDKKLQLLLGDCQKEFQGGNLSTEKLGSKYGGYGTFLPTHARAPSLLAEPHPVPPAAEPVRAAEAPVEPIKRVAGNVTQQVAVKENGVAGGTQVGPKVKFKFKLRNEDAEEAQRKALYNGLCLDHSSSASLDDDDTYSQSNVESPELSPMSMIQIMTSHRLEGGLLSPLCYSAFDLVDMKETMQKPRINSVTQFTGSKAELGSPVGPGLDYKKGKGWDKEKTSLVEAKKAGDLITDGDGGKRSRRDSDVDRKSVKESAGQWLPKSAKADISRAEQQDLADLVGGEAFGKDDYDSEREHPKNSRKQLDVGRSIGGNVPKEKEGVDAKSAGKLNSSKNRDSKEVSRNKVTITKIQVRKDYEPARLVDSDKETSDKVGSLAESHKHLKEDMKDGAVKMKEGPKEGVKENQRKDVVGDIKAKELHKDGMKSVGISGVTTKKSNSNVSNRKAGTTEQKGVKTVQDRRLSMKELDRERVNIPEPVAIREEEKPPTKVEPALAAAVVAPMPVLLDNWVACDKCEQWRLLMPHVNPDLLPKKWRCKMMDWLPGMNNCKFREEETTAAVYQKLGYQNPALVLAGVGVPLPLATTAMAVAPVPQQLSAPVPDLVSEKWADQTETKKTASLSKKGVARKAVPTGVKGAANKGGEGAIKSKNLSDVGLDSSADGAAVLTEKYKQRAKEKNKRIRPPEGEDSHIKKKVLQEQEHNVDLSQWEKEPMDIEPSRAGREREAYLPPEGEGTVLPSKRKKSGAFGDVDETLNFKKSKGSRAKLQVDETQAPSEDDLDGTDKRYNVQKPKRETLIHKSRETQHSNLLDKDTQQINSVLRDIESGNEKQRREEKEQTRMFTEERRLKTSQLEKHRRSKEEDSDSEQRIQKRRKDSDVHSERHHPVIKPKTPHFVNEDHNRSTSSKISNSSLGSSGVGLKGAGSPVESTVSSSPVRGMNGIKEMRNGRDPPGNPLADMGMHQQSCSPGTKNVRHASRVSPWDEGEFRQGGVSQNATRSRKYESSEARDDEWYNDEDRGADHSHTFAQHGERQAHGSREKDEMDEHHRRRHGNRDRGRLGARDNDHVDDEDRYLRERSTRDDRGRSRETGLEKPGGRSWDDNRKQEGVNHVLNKDDTAPVSVQGHGPKDGGFSKDPSREGDRTVSNSRKESGLTAVGPSDTMINKRLVVSSNARILGERGDALKREDLEVGGVKPSVGEGVAGSPAKKEYGQAQHLANVAIKDGTSLKHSADRLKGSAGDDCESTNLYLQAALKFLQAAAMLEPIYAETARQGEVTQSMTLYIDTAKLCDYCAITYRRSGDLRAVALAYTCAAVARVRVVMAKQACFARDTSEFRNAMQLDNGPHVASNGESPSSSSASDVDNLNNQQASILGNKVPMSKPTMVSPQVISGAGAGTAFVIPGRLRPVPTRFLRDAIDMSALLDSWQKAAEATAKAEASRDTRGMAAVKQVGELGGFGDIDGVVRLVRVAMEAIGH